MRSNPKTSMKIIACLVSDSDAVQISPFHEYLERYASPPGGETPKQKKKREKQIAHIHDTIKYVWEHNGSSNLPPLVELYINHDTPIIKITLADRLVRIAFFTIENEIVLLAAMDKPKRYEKAGKIKVDKEIQNFLDEAERNKEIYLKNRQGIDITNRIIG